MASNVAQPLERHFSLIAGLTQMTSQSGTGTTQITLQFELGRTIDAAALDVQAAINASTGQFPSNLPSPPTFRKVNPADAPILITVQSKTLPLIQVNGSTPTTSSRSRSRNRRASAWSTSAAQQKPAVRIQVDPAQDLAALGLSLEDIRGVIATATVNRPRAPFDGPRRASPSTPTTSS